MLRHVEGQQRIFQSHVKRQMLGHTKLERGDKS